MGASGGAAMQSVPVKSALGRRIGLHRIVVGSLLAVGLAVGSFPRSHAPWEGLDRPSQRLVAFPHGPHPVLPQLGCSAGIGFPNRVAASGEGATVGSSRLGRHL